MDKFKNKYRIPSARLQNWDYGNDGAYFITICTQNRVCFFGEILDGEMQLNKIGQLAEKFWLEIPNHFSFVELGNFVVMPNHTHGILIINKIGIVDGVPRDHVVEPLHCNGSTTNAKNEQMAKISPKSGTISTIVRSYKSVVSKYAHKIHADFAWQPRFHDLLYVIINHLNAYKPILNTTHKIGTMTNSINKMNISKLRFLEFKGR